MRRPAVRDRPQVAALLAFVPCERTARSDRKRENATSHAAGARSCGLDEKRNEVVGDVHGFLGEPCEEPAECERLRTAART